jgi:hypothetical protein
MFKTYKGSHRQWTLISFAATALLGLVIVAWGMLSGGGVMPKTHPVKGKVVRKDGTPFARGEIEFQLQSDPKVRARGQIQKDGTFTLTTHVGGKSQAGAVEGEHIVLILVVGAAKDGGGLSLRGFPLPNTYMVVPAENDFSFEFELPEPF